MRSSERWLLKWKGDEDGERKTKTKDEERTKRQDIGEKNTRIFCAFPAYYSCYGEWRAMVCASVCMNVYEILYIIYVLRAHTEYEKSFEPKQYVHKVIVWERVSQSLNAMNVSIDTFMSIRRNIRIHPLLAVSFGVCVILLCFSFILQFVSFLCFSHTYVRIQKCSFNTHICHH